MANISKSAARTLNMQAREALRQAREPGATWAARQCCLQTALAAVARLGDAADPGLMAALANG